MFQLRGCASHTVGRVGTNPNPIVDDSDSKLSGSSITIWILFQVNDWVNNHNFNVILISFWLKSIDFDIILIKKDQPKSIKRLKESIKRSKSSIKRSKLSIYIIKVNLFWLFQSFLIYLDLFLIKVDQFWTFQYLFELLEAISSQRLGFGQQIWIKKVD